MAIDNPNILTAEEEVIKAVLSNAPNSEVIAHSIFENRARLRSWKDIKRLLGKENESAYGLLRNNFSIAPVERIV